MVKIFFVFITGLFISACGGPIESVVSQDQGKSMQQADIPEPRDCGSENSILCGKKIENEDPWAKYAVYLAFSDKKGSQQTQLGTCTGVPIHRRAILTSAHCLTQNPNHIIVHFSTQPRGHRGTDLIKPELNQLATRYIIHPGYVESPPQFDQIAEDYLVPLHRSAGNDIGIIFLESDLPSGYAPVRIASINPSEKMRRSMGPRELSSSDGNLYILGYGYQDTGVEGDRRMRVAKRPLGKNLVSPVFPESLEFLWNQKSGDGICHGDSGGPVYQRSETKINLVGLSSMVFSKRGQLSLCDQFGLATYVPAYKAWINSEISKVQFAD